MTTSRWRLAAGIAVLAVLALMAGRLLPIYFRNLELQRFVDDVSKRPDTPATSDEILRTRVLDEAGQLALPVTDGNVEIERSAEGVHIRVRYVVRVDLPLYTVKLHFYPGAGSR